MKIRRVICFVLFFYASLIATPAAGAGLSLSAETGSVWFARNDIRIPADDGTKSLVLLDQGRFGMSASGLFEIVGIVEHPIREMLLCAIA